MQVTPQPLTAVPQHPEYYNPGYGTFDRPLQYAHWQTGFYVQPLANTQGDFTPSCTCGPVCECLGCFDHPLNTSTLEHVNDVVQFQNQHYYVPPSEDMNSAVQDGDSPPVPLSSPVTLSSTPDAGHVGSYVSSSTEMSPINSTDDYRWISVACHGDVLLCQCGDDCECLGCQIHNQEGTENPPTEEADNSQMENLVNFDPSLSFPAQDREGSI